MTDRFRLTPYKPKISEKNVIDTCIDYLNLRGYAVIRIPTGRYRTLDGKRVVTFGAPGMPDYCAIHSHWPGFFIEFKRPDGGVLSDIQKQKIHILIEAHRLAVTVCNSLDELVRWLGEHELRAKTRGP